MSSGGVYISLDALAKVTWHAAWQIRSADASLKNISPSTQPSSWLTNATWLARDLARSERPAPRPPCNRLAWNEVQHRIGQRIHGHPVHLGGNGPAAIGFFVQGVHPWQQAIGVLHPLAPHDMVQVSMGQQHLDGLNVELLAQRLKRLALCGKTCGSTTVTTVSVIDEISLLSKDIACEGMHHAA